MDKNCKNSRLKALMKSESGLTLIDTSVVLVIVGLLMIPVVYGLKLLHKQEASQTNDYRFYTIGAALENFYTLNGYYPCPADPTLGPDDASYGQPHIVVAGGGAGGGNDNKGGKDNDNGGVGGGNNGGGGVEPVQGGCVFPPGSDGLSVQGSLPFKALKLTAKEALDGWGNKITYAVTTSLTNQSTFNQTQGRLSIQDNRATCGITGTPITRSNYHFVFFSHGPTGAGAYSPEGNLVQSCQPSGPGAIVPVEAENCDGDRNFIYDLCMKSDVQGASFYDDDFHRNAGAYWRLPSKMWAKGTDQNNIGSRGVFVGGNNFDAQHELDVKGNVMVTQFATDPDKKGQVHATEFCDGALCTRPEMIAGSYGPMLCPSGRGMAGIGSNAAKCSNSTSSMPPQQCPTGQFVVGINADGTFQCGGP
jgi:hypothetical protein